MIIYNQYGVQILTVEVNDNSYRNRQIMGDHNLTLYFSLAEHIEIPIGAYCVYENEQYTIERPENLKMVHSRNFEYTVVMESPQAKAKIWKFRNTVDGRLKFPLTAKPHEHLQMFVDNMNRRDSGWTVGECIEGVETLISYDHTYCLEALSMIAQAFNTEFEITGKRVNLRKLQYNKTAPLPLSYGRGNGFKSGVARSNNGDTPPVEILFVQGGEENIDASKYGGSVLLLPKGQSIGYDGEKYEGQQGFISSNARYYIVDEDGLSIRRSDRGLSSLTEDSLDCSDIYPKRVGSVTGVTVVSESDHFYDFTDNTIPSDLNFEECLIDGQTMTVKFQTGMLAGREFEVAYRHNAAGGKEGRRFEIVPQKLDGQDMPNSIFCPVVGDKYIVLNCTVPDSYIRNDSDRSGASWDMFREAVRYLYEHEEAEFSFTGSLDGIWAARDWANIGGRIVLGGYILFSDERFQQEGVLVRITGIKDYINTPHSPEITLSNAPVSAGFSSTIKTLEAQEVLINEGRKEAVQYTQRRFRDAKETMSMIEAALLDNFTNAINPVSVQAMSLLVGDESLQYRFVVSSANPTPVAHNFNYDNAARQLTTDGGCIQHLTLGINTLSSAHANSEYKFWSVGAFTSATLTDGTKKYYLYIKASTTGTNADFRLSETPIGMTADGGYYHFLVGVLNSEYNGERSFATLYGYSEILPGRMTTDKIISGDGQSYFDMLNNAMKLGNMLRFNENGDGKLVLNGVLVQSESGSQNYIGCFRGVYNTSFVYYTGDEVTYTTGDIASTYRYINSTPASGKVPTNTTYWQVVAQGVKGDKGKDGTSFSIKGTVNTSSQLPTSGVAQGDAYIVNNPAPAHLWIVSSVSSGGVPSWTDAGQFKGDTGATGDTGAAGSFTELRYAKNGSRTTAPTLNKDAIVPSGWSTTMPTVGTGEYLWFTSATKSGTGTQLETQWATPVRITPYDGLDGKDGEDGKNGDDGENGKSPVMVFRGAYNSERSYYGNANRLDCVQYGNEYYIARIDAPSSPFSGKTPTNTTYWNSFGASFESVATQLLLAQEANIAGWIFRNNRLESQNGNTFLDGVNGTMRLRGTMQLSTGYAGNISDVNLFYLPAQTSDKYMTMGHEEEDIGKVVRLFNSSPFGGASYYIAAEIFYKNDYVTYTSTPYYVLVRPQEVVEMTCFELPKGSYNYNARWDITSRFGQEQFKQDASQGRYPVMLAMGRITGASNGVSISGTLYDGRSLSSLITMTRKGTGYYHAALKSGFSFPIGYRMIAQGYGTNFMKGTVANLNSTSFDVYCSDDASANDGTIDIFIFDPNWWYNMQ